MASRKPKFNIPKDEYAVALTEKRTSLEAPISNNKVVEMDLEDLIMDEENTLIYGDETEDSVRLLADDMKEKGFKGVILAYPVNQNKYQIESGHRRYLAARLAGLTTVKVLITEAPVTDSERRIRLISMNLHSRGPLKPTVMATVILTLLDANKEEQARKSLNTDMATLMDIVASQMELSVKSLEKYRQFDKLNDELKKLADEGISWSALTQASSLSEEKQKSIASSIWNEIERVSVDNVSGQWVSSLIASVKQETSCPPVKPKTVVKRRDGGKIIAKCTREFEDIVNGNVIFKTKDRAETLENLRKMKECIEQKIEEFSK